MTIRQWIAARRLARMVERNRQSFEIQDYRKRRAAALKGLGRNLSDHPGLRA